MKKFLRYLRQMGFQSDSQSLPQKDNPIWKSAMLAQRWDTVRDVAPDTTIFEAGRFVGYLEAICNIIAPEGWRERFRHVTVLENRTIRFDESTGESWCKTLDEALYVVGEGTFSRGSGGEVAWSDGVTSINISSAIHKPAYHDSAFLAVAHDDKHVYVCFFGRIGFTHKLLALAKTSGETVWSAPVWATGLYGWSGPLPKYDHRVQLMVSKGQVFVFGACVQGAYCEAFRIDDGAATLRFTNHDPANRPPQ